MPRAPTPRVRAREGGLTARMGLRGAGALRFKHALKEALAQPAVAARIKDTKASQEARPLFAGIMRFCLFPRFPGHRPALVCLGERDC